MSKRTKILITIYTCCFILFCQSCSDDDPVTPPEPRATVSGKLLLPETAEGKSFLVAIDDDMTGDNGFTYSFTGTCCAEVKENYTISDVKAGTYFIYAVVFCGQNSDKGPQCGDFLGVYGGSLDYPPLSPNAEIPSGGTANFDITLYKITEPIASGRWSTSTDFGGFEFVVNDETNFITEVKYIFDGDGNTSGGSIVITSSPGWPIIDRNFSITNKLSPSSNDQIIIIGSFSSDGKTASGTWDAIFNNASFDGIWTALPK